MTAHTRAKWQVCRYRLDVKISPARNKIPPTGRCISAYPFSLSRISIGAIIPRTLYRVPKRSSEIPPAVPYFCPARIIRIPYLDNTAARTRQRRRVDGGFGNDQERVNERISLIKRDRTDLSSPSLAGLFPATRNRDFIYQPRSPSVVVLLYIRHE